MITLRCPNCNRFLAEVDGYGRAVCSRCGAELTYRSKEERFNLDRRLTEPSLPIRIEQTTE